MKNMIRSNKKHWVIGGIVVSKSAPTSLSRRGRLRIPRAMAVAGLLLSATAAPGAPTREAVENGPRTISFETRLAGQRGIEEVYWKHRIWPEQNLEPKPSLDAVLPA